MVVRAEDCGGGLMLIGGHEYLKRQLARRAIAFEALDNGILSCADPAWLDTCRPIPWLATRSAVACSAGDRQPGRPECFGGRVLGPVGA